MPSHIDDLLRRIADLERELEGEFGRARGDVKGYQKRLPLLRAELRAEQPGRDR